MTEGSARKRLKKMGLAGLGGVLERGESRSGGEVKAPLREELQLTELQLTASKDGRWVYTDRAAEPKWKSR